MILRMDKNMCMRIAAQFSMLLLAIFFHVSSADAHASLISTNPAEGSIEKAAPAQFLLRFSEPVSPLVLKLIGPDGRRKRFPGIKLRDQTLEIDSPNGLATGTHVLTWRVTLKMVIPWEDRSSFRSILRVPTHQRRPTASTGRCGGLYG